MLNTKYLRVVIVFILSSAILSRISAQNDSSYTFKLYGFVRNDFTYDTRKTLASVGELFSYIPYDVATLDDGTDANAVPAANFLAITSRVGFDVASPLYGKTRFNAKIEADFFGSGNVAPVLRLRQAFINAQFGEHHSLLFGQTWHPLQADLIPSIVSLNTGAPFSPFSRTPQLKYSVHVPHATLSAAIIYQLQYTSTGPDGASTKYQVWKGLPEFYVGANFNVGIVNFGASGEYTRLTPRLTAQTDEGKFSVNEHVRSLSAQLYVKVASKHFTFMGKTLYGENTAHLLMMSGYGAYQTQSDAPYAYNYAPLRQSTSWVSVAYRTSAPNHNIKATLFAGYMKNFGANRDLLSDKVYVRSFNNIGSMMRIAPSITYYFRDLEVALEYEYTGVNYGTPTSNFAVTNTHLTSNHRAYLIAVYYFNYQFNSKPQKKN